MEKQIALCSEVLCTGESSEVPKLKGSKSNGCYRIVGWVGGKCSLSLGLGQIVHFFFPHLLNSYILGTRK